MAGARGHCRRTSSRGDRSGESRRALAVCARGFRKASRFCLCRDCLGEGECLRAFFRKAGGNFPTSQQSCAVLRGPAAPPFARRKLAEGGLGGVGVAACRTDMQARWRDRAAQEPLDAALPAGAAGMLAESAAEEPAASIAGAPATRIPVVPLDEHAGLNHAAWGRGGLGPPPPIPSRLLILRA